MSDTNWFIIIYEFISLLANLVNVLQFIYNVFIFVQFIFLQQTQVPWDAANTAARRTSPGGSAYRRTEPLRAARGRRTAIPSRDSNHVSRTRQRRIRDAADDTARNELPEKTVTFNEEGIDPSLTSRVPDESGDCDPPRERKVPMMKVLSDSKKMLQLHSNRSSAQRRMPVVQQRDTGPQTVQAQPQGVRKNGNEARMMPVSPPNGQLSPISDSSETSTWNCKSNENKASVKKANANINQVKERNREERDASPANAHSSLYESRWKGNKRPGKRLLKTRLPCLDKLHNFYHRQPLHKPFLRQASQSKIPISMASKRSMVSSTEAKRKATEAQRSSVYQSSPVAEASMLRRSLDKEIAFSPKKRRGVSLETSCRQSLRLVKSASPERNRTRAVQKEPINEHGVSKIEPMNKWCKVVQRQAVAFRQDQHHKETPHAACEEENRDDPVHTRWRRSSSRNRCRSISVSTGDIKTMRSLVKKLSQSSGSAPRCTSCSRKQKPETGLYEK